MDKKIEHLKMVQETIRRMNTNSSLMKGWAVAVITGFFVLDFKSNSLYFMLLAIIPLVLFWFLDSYYLRQERLFRCLYDDIRTSQEDFNFTMDISPYLEKQKTSFVSCLWSKTEAWFYGVLIAVIVSVFVLQLSKSHYLYMRLF